MTIELGPVESGDTPPPRRNVVAVIAAATLVAAAGGIGFGIGRSLDDEPSSGAGTESAAGTVTVVTDHVAP